MGIPRKFVEQEKKEGRKTSGTLFHLATGKLLNVKKTLLRKTEGT